MLFEKIALEKDEEVLKIVRKHWFVIVAELLGVVFAGFLPIVLLVLWGLFDETLAAAGILVSIPASLVTFGIATWLLLCVITAFTIWTHYYLDLWIITDRRIISIDQVHFFNRTVSVFRLERLQDIEFRINGILATFLNFGTISAQTAGAHDHNFRATGMPGPRELQACIQSAMDKRLIALHIRPDLEE